MDPAAAKQFLIAKVIEQASLERVSLSEVEKKMLHFTEAHPSLPDIYEVNAEFERDYDSDQYEEKVVGLLKNARKRDSSQSPNLEQMWVDAISALSKEDHYILVMVYMAFADSRKQILPTHRFRDYLLYIVIGIGLVFALIGFAIWRDGR